MADNPTTEAQDIVDAWKRIIGVTLKPEKVQEHLDKLRKTGAIRETGINPIIEEIINRPIEKKSNEYTAYISSLQWQTKRRDAIMRAKNQCEHVDNKNARCKNRGNLEVHHKTYERLGKELPGDLMVVCKSCHKIEDGIRAAETSNRVYDARMDGWATKKYGEHWESFIRYEQAEEEFNEWLERND